MAKQILFGKEARAKIKKGANINADSIKITLGPKGRNIVIDKGWGEPIHTNDGVSGAKEVDLPDRFENIGAKMIQEVTAKTNEVSGDGTTTSAVLAQAIMNYGDDIISKGVNVMEVRKGIEAAAGAAIEELKKMARPIKTDEELSHIATISAESPEIGKIIAETVKLAGKDGNVKVQESTTIGIDKKVVQGLEFDQGYVSSYMITNEEKQVAEVEDVHIFVTHKKITDIRDIIQAMTVVMEKGKKQLVVIADDFEDMALEHFFINKRRKVFDVLAVKAPGYGDRKKDNTDDIALITGAEVITSDMDFDKVTIDMLGRAQKVTARKESTTILGGSGDSKKIEAKITGLKASKETAGSRFEITKIDERVAKLSGGIAVIRVGAPTEAEMNYLMLKIEDAVNATRAAVEEGVVPGGGSALVKVAEAIKIRDPLIKRFKKKSSFRLGYDAMVKALEAPFRQIIENAGKSNADRLIKRIKRPGPSGYDALNDVVVPDMFEAGIIDPVKVTRSGVLHSSSAAAILLTTEVAISEEPQPPMNA